MGIKWFTSFINHSSYKWEECRPKGIVIDGLSFIYTFSENISWMEGGRYWLFREKLIEFFGCLESNHIEPIIVMDGPDFRNTLSEKEIMRFKKRERKNQVIAEWVVHDKESKNACDSPTPILTFGIFSTVMKELGVEVFAAKGEADQDTVAIANYYNYPVLANDSDYYMYDIKAGYIPIDRFNW